MLLCCGADGLLTHRQEWQTVSCPLPSPSLMACCGTHRAILDNREHMLWLDDRLFSIDQGIERLLMWQGCPLLLSGETNALTLLHPCSGLPLFLASCGAYPQDMCLLPDDTVAVCSGVGSVPILHLPDLRLKHEIPMPGSAQRIARHGRWLYVLCAADDGLTSLLCRTDPRSSQCETLCMLSGLPGSLCADPHGVWAAVGETLHHFGADVRRPRRSISGFGLVRHIASQQHRLLLSDTAAGALYLLKPRTPPRLLMEGDVGQAMFL